MSLAAEPGSAPTLAEPVREADRILDAAEQADVSLGVAGGVGIALSCPSAHKPPLSREYQDIDFVVRKPDVEAVGELLGELGYEPEEELNVIHGHRRLFFLDRAHLRQADVFIDEIEACHRLDLRSRLGGARGPLAPADLLLSKLQVIETNEKDMKDAMAVLADHALSDDDRGVSRVRLAEVCAHDWGWWRTVSMVAERSHGFARTIVARYGVHEHVPDRILELLRELERAPKSRRWKLRARLGERVRWHDTPDEVEHGAA